jgi:hypothetical protein
VQDMSELSDAAAVQSIKRLRRDNKTTLRDPLFDFLSSILKPK